MPYDLLIENGIVVDGTGSARRSADIAISQGCILEIGSPAGSATRVIDASRCIVAPGFIDPHTHYDAQICWDTAITPSSWHGVTTVVMGNCGVGIAPCRPAGREVVMRDLVGVEAIEFDVLQRGITWDWETFPQYLDAAARRGSALNLAFLVPLTPLRHYVMGEASMERAATPQETAEIKALLKNAVAAGAFGFSTTIYLQHLGHAGRPLACRNASLDEIRAYCNALKELGKGAIEIALTKTVSVVSDEEYELLDLMLRESERPVTFTALLQREDMPDAFRASRHKLEPLISRGAAPQTSARPLTREITLRSPFLFGAFPSWLPVFDKPKDEQAAIYRSNAFRDAFREELKTPKTFSGGWSRISVSAVSSPSLRALEGRTIAEIALERGTDGVDVLLDVGLSDDLDTEFSFLSFNTDAGGVAEILRDPNILIGMGDAGAHLDLMCDAGYTTYVLGNWVREKQVLSLEDAVQRMTSHPADVFGIKDRGRLLPGLAADLVVFDAATVGSGNRPEKRYDLPGGGKRYVMPSNGVEWTIVNGEVVYEKGNTNHALPGRVLRS